VLTEKATPVWPKAKLDSGLKGIKRERKRRNESVPRKDCGQKRGHGGGRYRKRRDQGFIPQKGELNRKEEERGWPGTHRLQSQRVKKEKCAIISQKIKCSKERLQNRHHLIPFQSIQGNQEKKREGGSMSWGDQGKASPRAGKTYCTTFKAGRGGRSIV